MVCVVVSVDGKMQMCRCAFLRGSQCSVTSENKTLRRLEYCRANDSIRLGLWQNLFFSNVYT